MKQPAYLLLLAVVIVVCGALSIGLTYVPCHAALCVEDYYPYPARLHIAFYYALVASVGAALLLRACSPSLLRLSRHHLTADPVPFLGSRVSVGGVLLCVWLVGLTCATAGFWYGSAREFWGLRTEPLGWAAARARLTATTVMGHWADVLLGLLLIPVGRNSLLGTAFGLHQSTLLFAHKLLSYATIVTALAHGLAYYTFVAIWGPLTGSDPRKESFNVDIPNLGAAEGEGWHMACLPTGMFAFIGMLALLFTSLPAVRRRSYNTFYYTHVIGGIIIFVAVCIHASTDFYFLLPGLVLWLFDWALRLFGGGQRGRGRGLTNKVTAVVEDAGEGWYRIVLPPLGRTLGVDDNKLEAGRICLPSMDSPIQSYNINIPAVSKIQNHAFTAAVSGTVSRGPVLLFRRSQGKAQPKLEKEWTWKLAAMVGFSSPSSSPLEQPQREEPSQTSLDLRVEGPYSPSLHNLSSSLSPHGGSSCSYDTASHIVCLVGGTGLTGAHSLAKWWLSRSSSVNSSAHPKQQLQQTVSEKTEAAGGVIINPPRRRRRRLTLIWAVRHREMATALREWRELVAEADKVNGSCISHDDITMRIVLHVSSESGRMRAGEALREAIFGSRSSRTTTTTTSSFSSSSSNPDNSTWIYASGPETLLGDVETTCLELRKDMRMATRGKKSRYAAAADGEDDNNNNHINEEGAGGGSAKTLAQLDWYLAKWEV